MMGSPPSPPTRSAPALVRGARPEDAPLLLELFRELAVYERLEHELRATEELVRQALFGERPAAEALLAEHAGETAGYALFFPTFSSFLAIQGVWLEDLFVRPAHRGAGIGRALLAAVGARGGGGGGGRPGWGGAGRDGAPRGVLRRRRAAGEGGRGCPPRGGAG